MKLWLMSFFFRSAFSTRIRIQLTKREFAQGAALFGAGDLVAQGLEGSSAIDVDSDRLVKATGIGSIYGGLLIPTVYQLAESLFPGRTPRNVLLKTALSCSMLSTGGNYASLLARRVLGSPWIEEESLFVRFGRCLDSVNSVFQGVLLNDLRVWPLYDMFCFTLIPAQLRPTATACVSVCWHTYLSFVASRAQQCAPLIRRTSSSICHQ